MRVPSRFLTLAALAVFVALAAAPSARAEVLPGVIQPTLPPGTAGDDGTDSLTPFEEAVINVGNDILHHNDTIGEEGSDGVRDRTSPPPSPLHPCNLLATQASPLPTPPHASPPRSPLPHPRTSRTSGRSIPSRGNRFSGSSCASRSCPSRTWRAVPSDPRENFAPTKTTAPCDERRGPYARGIGRGETRNARCNH